jgi:hypothetical protein
MDLSTENHMRWMTLLFLLANLFAPLALAQVPPVGGGGQVNVNATVAPAPTWTKGVYKVWEVANGTPISHFGFQATVTSSTGSDAKLIGGMTPMPATAVQSEWDSGGQYLPTPFTVTPTSGVLEDDTFYVVSFSAQPPGGSSIQLWSKFFIIVGKPKDAGFNLDIQFVGGTQPDNATVIVPLNTSVSSCYPAFTASFATDLSIVHTSVTPLGTTGIQESEFCGGPNWTVNVPWVWPVSGNFNAPGQHVFRVIVLDEAFNHCHVSEFTVEVPAPLQITTASPLPNGSEGVSYNLAFAASGGVTPYAWSGAGLPSGWTIDAAGLLSASAAAVVAGTLAFDVTVTDSQATPETVTLPFAVDVLGPLAILTQTLPAGTHGYPYAAALTASGGSGSGYNWTLVSGAIPAGINGMPGNGTPTLNLSGSPAVSGLFVFEVQVTDDVGNLATMQLSIQVSAPGLGSGGSGSGGEDSGAGCSAAASSGSAWWWLVWFVATLVAVAARRAGVI